MVDRVKGVEKVTDNPFLNLYNFDVEKRNGKTGKYYPVAFGLSVQL